MTFEEIGNLTMYQLRMLIGPEMDIRTGKVTVSAEERDALIEMQQRRQAAWDGWLEQQIAEYL